MHATRLATLALLAACHSPGLTAPDAALPADLAGADLSMTPPGDMAAASGAVRFVAIGDVGKGNATQKAVGDAIAAFCALNGCDFVQLLGDNIYDSGVSSTTDAQWQTKFEVPYAAVNLPFWVVLGNHDYGTNGAGLDFPRALNEIAYSAVSTKWHLPAKIWHRTSANVEMFGLDTNTQMVKILGAPDADAHRTQMTAWLAASTAEWKIAFGHHPYLSNGDHGNAGDYDSPLTPPPADGSDVKDFLEDVVCGKVDLYICGHDHVLDWEMNRCAGTELIVSGTGASSTSLPGSNPSHYKSLINGFLYVVIDGKTFTGQFIDASGATLYTRSLTKP